MRFRDGLPIRSRKLQKDCGFFGWHSALRENQTDATAYRCLAAALAHLGRDAEARKTVAQLLEIEPHFRISEWVARTGIWQAQMYIDGLRKAGLAE
jgi:adenylate cyclase